MHGAVGQYGKNPIFVAFAMFLLWFASEGACDAGILQEHAEQCETMSHGSAYGVDTAAYNPNYAVAIKKKDWKTVRTYLLWHLRLPEGLTTRQKARLARERISAELIPASARGDRAAVSRLLRAGGDPNAGANGDDYAFPLAWAARCDRPEVVKTLLAHGAKVNARFGYTLTTGVAVDSTALEWAVLSGARRSVAILLAHSANPHLTSHFESLPDVNGMVDKGRGASTVLDSATDPEIKRMIRKALKDRRRPAKTN